jgi:hypothetical protein
MVRVGQTVRVGQSLSRALIPVRGPRTARLCSLDRSVDEALTAAHRVEKELGRVEARVEGVGHEALSHGVTWSHAGSRGVTWDHVGRVEPHGSRGVMWGHVQKELATKP